MYEAPFPSKANAFTAGKPSEFASSAGTFDPTMQLTAQLAAGSSIKIETLETTWKTIVNGIDETQQI